MREFIRHPVDIPIEFQQQDEQSSRHLETLANISQGGLAFRSQIALGVGMLIQIRIALHQPVYQARARVAWCRPAETGYYIGAALLDPGELFHARMVEQLCYIEHYKQMVLRTQGRRLSGQDAALEWISKFAGSFPQTELDPTTDQHDTAAKPH